MFAYLGEVKLLIFYFSKILRKKALETPQHFGYNAKVYAKRPIKREEMITMSASSKKKLRKEKNAANLTERQKAAMKEEKKLKAYTWTFWIVMILIVAIVAGMFLEGPVNSVIDRVSTAVVVGNHKLSSTELSYFYIDAINNYCQQYSSWISYLIDTSTPLSEQIVDEATGETWADNFVEMAISSAKNTYALYDEAVAKGHTLNDEEKQIMKELYDSMDEYAKELGYHSATQYLQAIYGDGASKSSYKKYYEVTVLASSYYSAYAEQLENSYEPVDLRNYEAETPYEYNSYSYASFYLDVDDYKTGGTKGEDDKITYSAEEIAAAEAAVKEAAERLAIADNNTVEKLNAAIAALEKAQAEAAKDEEAAEEEEEEEEEYSTCTESTDVLYSSVSTVMNEWMRDEARTVGDIAALVHETTSTGDDGEEVKTVEGYYVVLFLGINENTYPLANVRHILVAFEGGTYNSTTGTTTYSDEEKAAAKETAEELLAQWESGAATEESFAELANEKSADGDGTTGGLYEDVYPGQMVTNFNDWCFDDAREVGDTGIVESTYGYHVMFYSGDSETNYRDYMITQEMLSEDLNEWQEALNNAITVVEKNTKRLDRDIVLSTSGMTES